MDNVITMPAGGYREEETAAALAGGGGKAVGALKTLKQLVKSGSLTGAEAAHAYVAFTRSSQKSRSSWMKAA